MECDYDIGLREYQERIQKQQDLPKYTAKIIDKYVNQGVIPLEAKILAHFSVLAEVELIKAEIDENVFKDGDDMYWMCNFKVNNEGHIIELYLHHTEKVFLTLLPKMLCKLEYLEIICFPNNLIKEVPEWITNLRFLRDLDVSNADRQNPKVPDSIKSYIESLESFNEFY